MIIIVERFESGENIPVRKYLKNKKLAKYFNRETAATIVAMSKLSEKIQFNENLPFYFSLGQIEYEDYGLQIIVEESKNEMMELSNENFIEKALPEISPLNQFKVLQNMPLSFTAIEFNLLADNAVVYSNASGLLLQAINSGENEEILIGASKAYKSGEVEIGVALLKRKEIIDSKYLSSSEEAIEMFKDWYEVYG